jgi:Tfp pilus assembly protein PilN
MIRPSTGDEEKGPIAVVDIDSNFSDFMVILNGEINLTRALSIGSAKLLEGQAREIERLAEEIQRAVDLYESESIGLRITKLVVMGAEIELVGLTIESLTEKLRVPVEVVSLLDSIPGAREVVDVPEAQRGALSFAAVLGLAWDPGGARIDLTPPEVRIREALVQKGRALVFLGMLVISILTALTVLIWQPIYFKKQYLEQLQREVRRTQEGAGEVESLRKKIKILKEAARLQNSSLEILSVLHKTLPSEIYLKAVTFQEGSQVTLKGVSQRMSAVFEYVAILEKLPNFRQVKTRHVTKSGDKGGNEEADFEITCPLRRGNEV